MLDMLSFLFIVESLNHAQLFPVKKNAALHQCLAWGRLNVYCCFNKCVF